MSLPSPISVSSWDLDSSNPCLEGELQGKSLNSYCASPWKLGAVSPCFQSCGRGAQCEIQLTLRCLWMSPVPATPSEPQLCPVLCLQHSPPGRFQPCWKIMGHFIPNFSSFTPQYFFSHSRASLPNPWPSQTSPTSHSPPKTHPEASLCCSLCFSLASSMLGVRFCLLKPRHLIILVLISYSSPPQWVGRTNPVLPWLLFDSLPWNQLCFQLPIAMWCNWVQ